MSFYKYYLQNTWFMLAISIGMIFSASLNSEIMLDYVIGFGVPALMVVISLILSRRNYNKLRKGGFL